MKAVKAKVLGTGEEIIAVKRLDNEGMYFDVKNGVDYKRDEIEIIEDLPEGLMPGIPSSKHDLPDTERLLAQVLDRQQNTFWRDKRVEIVEILLKRGDYDVESIVGLADKIIRELKAFGD